MGIVTEDMTAIGAELQILLIEPSDDTRSLLELALSARGHAVTTGIAAADALQALASNSYALVVVNAELPDMPTPELCRRVRAIPSGRGATIIVLSDHCEAGGRTAALEAGANECLSWPGDALLLRTHIESAERAARAPRFERVIDTLSDIVLDGEALIVLARDGMVQDVDASVEEWLACKPGELIGVSAFTLFHLDDAPELLSLSTQATSTDGPTGAITARLRMGGESWRRLRLRAVSKLDDPHVRGIVLLASLVANDTVHAVRAALRDATTGLPNSALYMDRLDHALQLAHRRGESVVAMVIDVENGADLDGLYGNGALEQAARQIGERLLRCLRVGDTVGRLRAEEFGTIIEGFTRADEPLAVARRIVADLSEPFVLAGQAVELTPCVGIALAWGGHSNAEEVLRQARLAHRNAATAAQADGHVALVELGEMPAAAEEPRYPQLVEQPEAEPQTPMDDSLWFSPLMDRIGALEREIGRLNERREAARSAVAG
ncbi:MAG: hypothetical protein DCC58_13415 [Chloroflexi bacterium]|nr:MAG: hypothetical protein DCC58_13415 [Chloroflexota bacterium]